MVILACNGMTSGMLGGIPGADSHGIIKTTYAASWGLQVKDSTIAKVNASKLTGVNDWNMLFPTCKTISLKPKMMLHAKSKSSNMVSDLGLGGMVLLDGGFISQQKFLVRIYEIGPDKKVSVETLMNYMQETLSSHLKEIELADDSLDFIPETSKSSLLWAMTKMQMDVDRYPTWGDVVQINTWKATYGKNGMCCNCTFYDCKTGEILVRASSVLVMMNKKTRKLSRFPNEVRAKIEQYSVDTPLIVAQDTRKWLNQDNHNIADHVCKGLTPRWSDLDINQHVNSGKYIGLILESVPKPIIEKYEVASMTLVYCRECTKDSVLQSHTSILAAKDVHGEIDDYDADIDCQHVLRLENGDSSGAAAEIMRGRTRWRPKYGHSQERV